MEATSETTITLIMNLEEAKKLHEILYQYSRNTPNVPSADQFYAAIGRCLP